MSIVLPEEFWDKHAFVRVRGRSRMPEEPSQVILENKIFMGNIRSQDDIYEGHPRFSDPQVPTRAEVYSLASKHMRGASHDDVEAQVDLIMARLADDGVRRGMVEEIRSVLGDLYGGSSILSFLRTVSDQRTWAQYGDAGRGHAFVFDFRRPWPMQCGDGMGLIDAVPFPVTYLPEERIPALPIKFGLHAPDDGWNDIQLALLMKAERWSDQREERLVRIGIGQGFVEFPPESLKAIVLGYDSLPDDELFFKELIARRKAELALYKLHAHRVERRLELQFL